LDVSLLDPERRVQKIKNVFRVALTKDYESHPIVKMATGPVDPELGEAPHGWHENKHLQAVITSAICLSAIQIGIETDHEEPKVLWRTLEIVWSFVFTMEICCHFADFGIAVFKSPALILDMALVVMSLLDVLVFSSMSTDAGTGMKRFSVLRLLRLVRLLRIGRIIGAFRELMVILKGISSSVRVVSWACLLMVAILYVCGIFCTLVIGQDKSYPGYSQDIEDSLNSFQAYGTMGRSMYSLFTIALGDDIRGHLQGIVDRQPWMMIFYVMFIMMCTFGVMNVIVGVIVDNTVNAGAELTSDTDLQPEEVMESFDEFVAWSEALDVNGDGFIRADQLVPLLHGALGSVVENPPVLLSAAEIFALFDSSGHGAIQIHEFLVTMMRCKFHTERQHMGVLYIELNRLRASIRRL